MTGVKSAGQKDGCVDRMTSVMSSCSGQEDGMGYLDTGAARACPRSGFVGNPADGRPSKIRGDPETTREPQKQRRLLKVTTYEIETF